MITPVDNLDVPPVYSPVKGGAGLGERLRKARDAAGLSLFGLAIRCGCTPQAIAKYERGSRPRGDILLAMARALRVAPEDLMPPVATEPEPPTPQRQAAGE